MKDTSLFVIRLRYVKRISNSTKILLIALKFTMRTYRWYKDTFIVLAATIIL